MLISVLWLWLLLRKRCIEKWHERTQCECLSGHKFMQHYDWDNVYMVLYLLINITWNRKCASIGQTLRTFHVIGVFVTERSHCPYQKQKFALLRPSWGQREWKNYTQRSNYSERRTCLRGAEVGILTFGEQSDDTHTQKSIRAVAFFVHGV